MTDQTQETLKKWRQVAVVSVAVVLFSAVLQFSMADQPANTLPSQVEAVDLDRQRDNKPVLVPAGVDVLGKLKAAGAPWDGEPIDEQSNYTGGSVDLSRRTSIFPLGSVAVDRADRGGIHIVFVRSGMGDRCGDPAAMGRAYTALAGPLNIPLPDEDQFKQLAKTWQSSNSEMAEIAFPGVMVRAIGGCIKTMVVKATA